LVEHDLAKVGVASSSLVSRSSFQQSLGSPGFCFFEATAIITVAMHQAMARWQSGHAAACKAAYAGSIPTLASIAKKTQAPPGAFFFGLRRVLVQPLIPVVAMLALDQTTALATARRASNVPPVVAKRST
jgi:hypothetical protein